MSSRRFLRTTFVVAGLALILAVATTGPAQAGAFPNQCYCGFWDFNADTFLGVPGVPYGDVTGDCFNITNSNRICSNAWGCGSFTQTGSSGSQISWDGVIGGIPFFAGGRIEITAGVGERRGPGAVVSGTTFVKDKFFVPAIFYNGTVEGASADSSNCLLP